VRSYDAPELATLVQRRSNGVLAAVAAPARGLVVDTFLRRYNIDPRRDMIVFALGDTTLDGLATLAGAWLTLRYWGVPHASMALLNGSVSELPANVRSTSASVASEDGRTRVHDLANARFELLADLGATRRAVSARAPLLDVRSQEEFDGAVISGSRAEDTCTAGAPDCIASTSGRLAGAQHLPLSSLLDLDRIAIKQLTQLDQALTPLQLGAEPPIIYGADGQHSAIAAFILLAVAGVEARWYASGFIEWGSLNATHPETRLRVVSEQSTWRTDQPELTQHNTIWADARHAARPLVIGANAMSADRVQRDDQSYLNNPPALPNPGGGGNPCALPD
jgi:3-mercaptopyruvate sulfurtransferase SseA